MTGSLLRTLAWLQWRLAVNRMRQGRQRDATENMSRMAELVTKVLLLAIALPGAVMLAALGGVAGWFLATGGDNVTTVAFMVAAILLMPTAWVVIHPFFSSAGSSGADQSVLLRLLPIPRRFLRHLELLKVLLDPMVGAFVPPVVLLSLAMAAHGAPAAALVTLLAGALFVASLACLGGLLSLGAQLLMRRRGRAELASLLIILALTSAGFVPPILESLTGHGGRNGGASQEAPARAPDGAPAPQTAYSDQPPAIVRLLPSASYATVALRAASGRWRGVPLPLASLALMTAFLYAASVPVYRRLVTTPESGSRARPAERRSTRRLRFPLLERPVMAVAVSELRANARTVRGKLALVYPAVGIGFIAVALHSSAQHTNATFLHWLPLAFMVFLGPSGVLVFSLNQFVVVGGGHVLEQLLPLPIQSLLYGKLIATSSMTAAATLVGGVVILAARTGTAVPLVLAAAITAPAIHVLLSPLAAVLSAIFPKPVTLSAIGRGAQPHQLAALINLFAMAMATIPPAGATVIAVVKLHLPWLAPICALLYLALALATVRGTIPAISRLVAARQENITMVVAGK